MLSIVRDVVPQGVNCVYVRQPEALGLGHAVLCARKVVGDDPFAVILADDLIDKSFFPQCIQRFLKRVHKIGICIFVESVPHGSFV